VNPVTGKATRGENYAARTRRHARAVIRSFYEYHREMHGRPLVNLFPQAKGAEDGRLNAHHNPMRPFRQPARRAAYQPKEPRPAPRSIPDQAFSDLFAGLACNRDRALIAFYISTGARASELLGARQGLVAPEEQTIGVIRKGSRALQHLPASADAFVWLRLYQQELLGVVPRGPEEPVWWTLRRPFRPLTYDAARMVFTRVNRLLGANWTLHNLRHSAAKRMVRDPHLSLADVQWVLGHAHITTTEIYTAPAQDEVIAHVLAHHERQRTGQARPPAPPAPGYRPEVLAALGHLSARRGEPLTTAVRDSAAHAAKVIASTQLRGRDWRRSTPTSPTGSGKPKTRAGSARSPRSRPPSPPPTRSWRPCATSPLAARPSTSACPTSVPPLDDAVQTRDVPSPTRSREARRNALS
jgi:integrase